MALTKKDFAILDEFRFDVQPLGVKLLARRPDSLDRLSRNMALCEMLKTAQEGEVFYADAQNHNCDAGLYVLGQTEGKEQFLNGEYGAGLRVFSDTRSASRLYHYISRIPRDVVNYVAFSPLNRLPFEPDVLVILANINQAEVLLRATTYETGKTWSSRYSAAIGCSWLLAYPYLTGEVNYVTTGLGFGMKRRKLFPEGLQLISVPFDHLHSLLQTLREMPWVPPPYEPDGLEYVKQLKTRLGIT